LKILIKRELTKDSVFVYAIKVENLYGYSIIKIGVSKNVEKSCGQFLSKDAHLASDLHVKAAFPSLEDALVVFNKLGTDLFKFRTYPRIKLRGSSTWYCECPGLRAILSTAFIYYNTETINLDKVYKIRDIRLGQTSFTKPEPEKQSKRKYLKRKYNITLNHSIFKT
jgi:hypothetical protein